MRGLLGLATMGALLATRMGPVAADRLRQDTLLPFGEPVSGSLSDETFRQVYLFSASAGDIISLSMERTDGDLDPYLLLMDEQGEIVAVSDDGAGMSAQIASWRVPEAARYFVFATRFGQGHGSTSGSYRLLLERAEIPPATSSTPLQLDSTTLGRITAQAPATFYFMRAERGDVVDLSMRRASGNLDPHLDLATADGHILASNDDDPQAQGTLDAAIRNYTVLESGLYVVVATRFGQEAGDTEGSYVLSAVRAAPGDMGATADRARLLDYGAEVSGTLDDTVYARYYWFEARRGDVVTVTQETDEGSLDPFVRLLDATFTELAQNDNSGVRGVAQILAYTLPETGRYYVVATRSGAQDGLTSGSYSLELSGRPGVIGTHALELPYGGAATGFLDGAHVSEEYVFFGQEGDVLTITLERTSDDLDPLVTLQDSARKQIAFDDDSAGNQNARLDRFVLPRDDMYIIVASRYDQEAGTTTGAYLLSLDLVRAGH